MSVEEIQFAGSRIRLVREAAAIEHLTLEDALTDLRAALGEGNLRDLVSVPRVRVKGPPGSAWLHSLRGRVGPWGVIGGKDYTSLGFETPIMWVTVVDAETGRIIAWVEAEHLSRVRTAAVTALATDLLAPPDCQTLAHFGVGKISPLLVRGVLLVRPSISKVLVVRGDSSLGLPTWLSEWEGTVAVTLTSPSEAADVADIITTATNSARPVLPDDPSYPQLRHLNLVGSNHLKRAEIGRKLASRCLEGTSLLVVDDRVQAAGEAGDFAALVNDGLMEWSDVPELAEVIRQDDPSGAELTVFKSVGTGLMDLIVAAGLLRRLQIS